MVGSCSRAVPCVCVSGMRRYDDNGCKATALCPEIRGLIGLHACCQKLYRIVIGIGAQIKFESSPDPVDFYQSFAGKYQRLCNKIPSKNLAPYSTR